MNIMLSSNFQDLMQIVILAQASSCLVFPLSTFCGDSPLLICHRPSPQPTVKFDTMELSILFFVRYEMIRVPFLAL